MGKYRRHIHKHNGADLSLWNINLGYYDLPNPPYKHDYLTISVNPYSFAIFHECDKLFASSLYFDHLASSPVHEQLGNHAYCYKDLRCYDSPAPLDKHDYLAIYTWDISGLFKYTADPQPLTHGYWWRRIWVQRRDRGPRWPHSGPRRPSAEYGETGEPTPRCTSRH